MSSSLDGRHVVLTRPVGRSFDLRKRLESLGAVVNEVPLLDVVSAPDGGASIREGARQLSEGDWIALVGDGRGGAALAELLGNPSRANEPVLLALAAEPIPDLEAGLRSAGFDPLVATAYATVERELSEAERRDLINAEVVVLTSPKGVRRAAAVLGPKRPGIIVMGPTTSAAAAEAGFRQVAVSPSPGIDGVLLAFEALLGTA